MRYAIRHRTTYSYAVPVHESFNEVRLQPMACDTQTVVDFDLVIDPPATVIAYRDYYGNAVHDFGVPYLHERLTIEGVSDVLTYAGEDEPLPGTPDAEDSSPPLQTVAGDSRFADEWAEFLGPSAYIVLEDASAELARSLARANAGSTAYDFFTRAAAEVRDRLEYRLGTTTVNSSVAEVLDGGSGVCQDFAHVLISLCRHAGLPARYVSGYLGNVGDSTASHAWAEAFVPPYGWVGVDATLGRPCSGRHVKVGVGRDYADVAVLRGTYHGGGQAALDVRVTSKTLGGMASVAELRGGADRRRGRLVAIQNLGAMRQYQHGAVMSQTMGGMSQTLILDGPLPARSQRRTEDDVPSQQPRQQQQDDAARPLAAGGS